MFFYIIQTMTREDFRFLIDTKKEYEFTYKGTAYNLTYGNEGGKDYIAFGERYMQKRFYSWGELMNEAKVLNSYLREMLEELPL